MILETDKALVAMLRAEALGEAPISVAFDAPNRPWIQQVKGVVINLYMFDIRENVNRRDVMYSEIRDENGVVTERRPPARRYDLYYNLTVWAPNPSLEHQVLACVLAGLGSFEAIPEKYLPPLLKDTGHVVLIEVAQGMKRGMLQNIAGELKTSIEIAVTVSVQGKVPLPLAPPARQQPTLVVAGNATAETAGGPTLSPEQKAAAQAAAMQRAAAAQAQGARPGSAAPPAAQPVAGAAPAAAPGATPAGGPAKPMTAAEAKAAQQAEMTAAAKQAQGAPPAGAPAGQRPPGAPAAGAPTAGAPGQQRPAGAPGQPQQPQNPIALAQLALAQAAQAQAQLAQAQALLARALIGGAPRPAGAPAPAGAAPAGAAPASGGAAPASGGAAPASGGAAPAAPEAPA